MPNNNPQGVNSFSIYKPEPPYGEITKAEKLKKTVPMMGTPQTGSALNTPDRLQKQATSPPKLPRVSRRAQAGPPPYDVEVASIFAEMSLESGAGPLTQKYAALAAARAEGQK